MSDSINGPKSINLADFRDVRTKFTIAYRIIIAIVIVFSILSLVLLLVPVLAISGVLSSASDAQALISVISGIVVFLLLIRFRPDQKVQDLLGDLSQITMVTDNYQALVGIQTRDIHEADPEEVEKRCEKLMEITKESVKLLDAYYFSERRSGITIEDLIENYTGKS